MLAETRDRPAVLKFFKKAIGSSGLPQKVNIDKSGSNTAGLEYINNLLLALVNFKWVNMQSSLY
jgi:putative transposase